MTIERSHLGDAMRYRHARFSLAIIFAFGVAMTVGVERAQASRLISIEVSLQNVRLLRGTMGDNGYVDADGVWRRSVDANLKPSQDFLSRFPDAKKGESLQLRRKILEDGSIVWKIDPNEVKLHFNSRLISRDMAGGLTDATAKE
jgi:hypothetical protein